MGLPKMTQSNWTFYQHVTFYFEIIFLSILKYVIRMLRTHMTLSLYVWYVLYTGIWSNAVTSLFFMFMSVGRAARTLVTKMWIEWCQLRYIILWLHGLYGSWCLKETFNIFTPSLLFLSLCISQWAHASQQAHTCSENILKTRFQDI